MAGVLPRDGFTAKAYNEAGEFVATVTVHSYEGNGVKSIVDVEDTSGGTLHLQYLNFGYRQTEVLGPETVVFFTALLPWEPDQPRRWRWEKFWRTHLGTFPTSPTDSGVMVEE